MPKLRGRYAGIPRHATRAQWQRWKTEHGRPTKLRVNRSDRSKALLSCTECGAGTISAEHISPGVFKVLCGSCQARTEPIVVDIPAWMSHARCAGDPPSASGGHRWVVEHCVRCPVVSECAAWGWDDPHISAAKMGTEFYGGVRQNTLLSMTRDAAIRYAENHMFDLAMKALEKGAA